MKYARQTIDFAQANEQADAFFDKALAMAENGDTSMLNVAILQCQNAEKAFLKQEALARSRATKHIACDATDPVNMRVERDRIMVLKYLEEAMAK